MQVEAFYPQVHGRWETADGCLPLALVGPYHRAMRSTLAMQRLNLAAAIGLALSDQDGAYRDTTEAETYGE